MAKSNVNNIKGQLVDHKVVNSPTELNNDEHGVLGVVIKNDDYNSLYVGNTHIASGYGLKSLEEVSKTEDIINNSVIQQIINGEYHPSSDTPSDNPGGGSSDIITIETNIEDSYVYYNGDKIKFEEGLLGTEISIPLPWLEVSNINVKFEVKTSINELKEINISSLDYVSFSIFDELTIKEIEFDYIINKGNSPIYYNIYQNNNGNRIEKPIGFDEALNLSDEDIIVGKKGHKKIENINFKIDNDSISNIKNMFIYFVDNNQINRLFIYIPICNIKYVYPIFGHTITYLNDNQIVLEENSFKENLTNDSFVVPFNSQINCNDNNEYLIQLGNNENNYQYLFIPAKYDNISFILKSSNIACKFDDFDYSNYIIEKNNISINYNIYKSPKRYNKKLDWIIKIW